MPNRSMDYYVDSRSIEVQETSFPNYVRINPEPLRIRPSFIDWGDDWETESLKSVASEIKQSKFIYLKPNNCMFRRRSGSLKRLNTLDKCEVLNIEQSWDYQTLYDLKINGSRIKVYASDIDTNRKII